jgi:hypothetical protein
VSISHKNKKTKDEPKETEEPQNTGVNYNSSYQKPRNQNNYQKNKNYNSSTSSFNYGTQQHTIKLPEHPSQTTTGKPPTFRELGVPGPKPDELYTDYVTRVGKEVVMFNPKSCRTCKGNDLIAHGWWWCKKILCNKCKTLGHTAKNCENNKTTP